MADNRVVTLRLSLGGGWSLEFNLMVTHNNNKASSVRERIESPGDGWGGASTYIHPLSLIRVSEHISGSRLFFLTDTATQKQPRRARSSRRW